MSNRINTVIISTNRLQVVHKLYYLRTMDQLHTNEDK